MKIKVFHACWEKRLEKKVNTFLAESGNKILQMQYAASFNGISVMVVYEEAENPQ